MIRRPAARPPVLTGCCAVAEVKVAGDAVAEIEVGGRGCAAGEVEIDGGGRVVDESHPVLSRCWKIDTSGRWRCSQSRPDPCKLDAPMNTDCPG